MSSDNRLPMQVNQKKKHKTAEERAIYICYALRIKHMQKDNCSYK